MMIRKIIIIIIIIIIVIIIIIIIKDKNMPTLFINFKALKVYFQLL